MGWGGGGDGKTDSGPFPLREGVVARKSESGPFPMEGGGGGGKKD